MKSYLAEVPEMIQVLVDIHFVAVEDGHPLNKHPTAMHLVGQFLQNIYCDDHWTGWLSNSQLPTVLQPMRIMLSY